MNRAVSLIGAVVLLWASAVTRLDAATRVALLQTDPKQTAEVVALLEARLSSADKFTLVERQQVEGVLHEQQLQAVLGADAVQGRESLGKLLQADLLVFIRPESKPAPHLEVVISESRHGLRLVHASVDAKEPAQQVAPITRLIDAAAARQSQQIDEIVAIPPFVSDDLGHQFDHLKSAYAAVIEGLVAEQQSTLVVELQEARALAKELELASGADVRRPLPLYVFGQFRNEGDKEARRVKITLKLMRGEQELASAAKTDLTADQAIAFLRESTTSFLAKSAAAPQPLADPKVEAAQLAQRARTMMSLGNWPEALGMLEASLLMDSQQPTVDRDAVIVLTQLAWNAAQRGDDPTAKAADKPTRLAYYLLGLEHVERYLRSDSLDQNRDFYVIGSFAGSLSDLGSVLHRDGQGGYIHASDWPLYVESRDAARDMIYRVLADKARRKVVDKSWMFLRNFDDYWIDEMDSQVRNVDHEPRAVARRDRRLKLLADFVYLPDEGNLLRNMLMDTFPQHFKPSGGTVPYSEVLSRPEFIAFLRSASELPNESLRKAAAEKLDPSHTARQKAEEAQYDKQGHKSRPPNEPNTDAEVTFTKLELRVKGASESPVNDQYEHWRAVAKGVDFIWNRGLGYLMRERGVLLPIRIRDGRNSFGQTDPCCFDGRFVWIDYGERRNDNTQHTWFVVDPQDGKIVQEIDPTKLLPYYGWIEFSALGQGRVAVVGYFGQTFIAEVECRPGGEPKARIIHEFRKESKSGDFNVWRDPDLVFEPLIGAFTLSEAVPGGGTKQALLVGRQYNAPQSSRHPLIVQLPGGEARPIETDLFESGSDNLLAHDGSVYRVKEVKQKAVLYRFSLSGMSERVVSDRFNGWDQFGEIGCLLEYGGLLHCIDSPKAGGTWSVVARDAGQFRTLKMNLPPDSVIVRVFPSEHYGLLANIRRTANGKEVTSAYQVSFSKPLSEIVPATSPDKPFAVGEP